MKKAVSLVLAIVLIICLFAGCAGKNAATTEPPSANSTETASAQNGAQKDTVTVGINVSLNSLQPMTAIQRDEQYVLSNVFDTLIELIDGEYVGELAESFSVSDDGMAVTVKLREGVKFHNGDTLTTKDLAYTYDGMKNYSYYANDATYYDHTEIIDEYNCVIHAAYQTPLFMLSLATVDVVNERAITEANGDDFQPVGTGPYKFVSYDGFNNILLDANEDYFKGAPEIKHLNYRIFSDDQTMTMSLEAGEIDIIGVVDPTNASRFEGKDKYTVTWKDADGVYLLLFNTTQAPFDSKEVRQAISYALDRESINLIISEGKCGVRDAFYSEKQAGAPDYDELPHYTFDQEKAMSLLEDAGYPNGFTLDEPVRVTSDFEKLAVVMQQQLAEVGIRFEIEVLEANTLFNNYLFVCKYNMMPFSLSTELYDMAYCVQFFDASSQIPNMTGYDNAEVTALAKQASAAQDMQTRKELYTQIWTILADEQPITTIMSKKVAEISVSGLVDDEKVLTEVQGRNLHWN